MVDRPPPPLRCIAGAKKNAFSGCAVRRSLVGIRPMSPVTLISAAYSALGWPVSSAPLRSADSSRYRDSSRISTKLTA